MLVLPAAGGPVGAPLVAVLLALTAAVLFGLATVRQHGAVRRLPGSTGLAALLRSPGWLAGTAQTGVAGGLHLTALALAPIALVQPLGVLAVPVAVAAHARTTARPPARRHLVGATSSVLGTAGLTLTLLLGSSRSAAVAPPFLPAPGTVLMLAAAALVVPVLAGLGRGPRPTVRAVLAALAGAALFGLTSVLLRTATTAWAAGRPDVAVAAVGAALVVAAAGLVSVQRAHRTGSPTLVVCCLTLLDPLVATAGAGALLHETPALTGGGTAAAVLCCLLSAAGVVLLAGDHPAAVPPPGAGAAADPSRTGSVPSRDDPLQPVPPVLTRSTS